MNEPCERHIIHLFVLMCRTVSISVSIIYYTKQYSLFVNTDLLDGFHRIHLVYSFIANGFEWDVWLYHSIVAHVMWIMMVVMSQWVSTTSNTNIGIAMDVHPICIGYGTNWSALSQKKVTLFCWFKLFSILELLCETRACTPRFWHLRLTEQ